MIDLIIWIALTMSLATGVLAVWVFNHLVSGGVIVPNHTNLIELWASILITGLVIVALAGFTVRKLRH